MKKKSKSAKAQSTVVSPEIAVLQAQVEAQKRSLLATKLMLNQLRKASKKPFIETKVGRAYLQVVKTLTNPLAKVYSQANSALVDPAAYRRDKLYNEGQVLLAKAHSVENNQSPEAKAVTLALAEFSLRAKTFLSQAPEPYAIIEDMIEDVDKEVARLRPAVSAEAQEELKQKIAELSNVALNAAKEAAQQKE